MNIYFNLHKARIDKAITLKCKGLFTCGRFGLLSMLTSVRFVTFFLFPIGQSCVVAKNKACDAVPAGLPPLTVEWLDIQPYMYKESHTEKVQGTRALGFFLVNSRCSRRRYCELGTL